MFMALFLLSGCGDDDSNTIPNYTNKVSLEGSALPYTVLDNTVANGAISGTAMEIRNGGFGSAAFKDPHHPNRFYTLTDRGPNADYTNAEGTKGKMFPVPSYVPRVGHFEIKADGSIEKIAEILLKDTAGNTISGLPNPEGLGGTKEIPFDKNGEIIADGLDEFGLDGEGLVVLKDGSFWVSDEYGPHMVHFDQNGKEIGRINPFTEDARTSINLPAEFANRWANRGMEGLAITPDEKTLVGIMQSSLDNPKTRKDLTRIVSINLETKEIKQYLYKQDGDANSNSEIVALDNDTFLVIERDGKFYQKDATAMKKIYKIKLSTGTDIENLSLQTGMVQDQNLGLLIDEKTLETISGEENSWEFLASKGIVPVEKTLTVDMIAEVGYPHDKMEGLVVFDEHTLGVINDDDFATWVTNGVLEQKYLDNTQRKEDGNTLYVIKELNLLD